MLNLGLNDRVTATSCCNDFEHYLFFLGENQFLFYLNYVLTPTGIRVSVLLFLIDTLMIVFQFDIFLISYSLLICQTTTIAFLGLTQNVKHCIATTTLDLRLSGTHVGHYHRLHLEILLIFLFLFFYLIFFLINKLHAFVDIFFHSCYFYYRDFRRISLIY